MEVSERWRATLAVTTFLCGCTAITDIGRFEEAPCTPRSEICDERDNDCDGMIDEGIDLSTDATNCGACGSVCPDGPNSNGVCEGGVCSLVCDARFADCNDDATDGCEAELDRSVTCGSCGQSCVEPTPACADGMCVTCDPASLCPDGACPDFATDALNCGSCGNVCGGAHAMGVCNTGTCGLACVDGFGDCNGDISDGCEAVFADDSLNCGSCGNPCQLGCEDGSCVTAVDVDLGRWHSCAVLSNGRVACWGDNTTGQLGTGDLSNRMVPARVALLDNVTSLSAGTDHACALRSGVPYCWGLNTHGQTLAGVTSARERMPLDSMELGVIAVTAGGSHTCIQQGASTLRCAGANGQGQSDPGRPDPVLVPASPFAGVEASSVSLGARHTCAVSNDGGATATLVRCWGDDAFGQATAGGTPDASGITRMLETFEPTLVAAGGQHTCAATSSGVYCWGSNRNEVRGVAGTPGASPNLVSGTDAWTVTSLDAGERHTCAVHDGGSLECWGMDMSGQLGDGPAVSTRAALPGTWTSVAVGELHTCAIDADSGFIYCWGAGGNGRLGTGTAGSRDVPTLVAPIEASP